MEIFDNMVLDKRWENHGPQPSQPQEWNLPNLPPQYAFILWTLCKQYKTMFLRLFNAIQTLLSWAQLQAGSI
jgi:hypothetical protein